jgi:hypothetical protein
MAYLTKEAVLLKLSPYGVKSLAELNRLIREQGLPTRYITPRKPFWDETEIDVWLSRRNENVAKANINHVKLLRIQRKKRKDEKEKAQKAGFPLAAEMKALKKTEA